MVTQNEPEGIAEEAIVVVAEEVRPPAKGVPPVDMQCAAAVGKDKEKRHKVEVYWDEDLRVWSSLCEKHTKQNDKARMNEATKVVLYG